MSIIFKYTLFSLQGHIRILQGHKVLQGHAILMPASKEVVLFHGNAFVLLRFARGFN